MNSVNDLSCLSLAFVGDGVYTLLVRERMAMTGSAPARLHELSVALVNASAQAKAGRLIAPMLNEREADVMRRARNAHVGSTPKNASSVDYHAATSLESLFGWLWLNVDQQRARELFGIIWENRDV